MKKAGKANKTKAARALTDDEVDVLHSKKLLGVSSPESLLNILWLNNTQHFGLRGCHEHRNMRWGDVQLQTSAKGTGFLGYTERQTKTRTGAEPKDTRTVKLKMFSDSGSDRDPLIAFHLYAAKRLVKNEFRGQPVLFSGKPHQYGKFFKTLVQSSANGCQQVEFTHEDHGSKSGSEC